MKNALWMLTVLLGSGLVAASSAEARTNTSVYTNAYAADDAADACDDSGGTSSYHYVFGLYVVSCTRK